MGLKTTCNGLDSNKTPKCTRSKSETFVDWYSYEEQSSVELCYTQILWLYWSLILCIISSFLQCGRSKHSGLGETDQFGRARAASLLQEAINLIASCQRNWKWNFCTCKDRMVQPSGFPSLSCFSMNCRILSKCTFTVRTLSYTHRVFCVEGGAGLTASWGLGILFWRQ